MDFQGERVRFASGAEQLQGELFVPQDPNGQAVTVMGPVAYVKEQAPTNYGRELAARGYHVLIFDPTYHGESGGVPRRYENGEQKTADVIASLDYLETDERTAGLPVSGLGVCQGINWMINAANQDDRIGPVALVAGHYLAPDVAENYSGGPDGLRDRLDLAQQARDQFEADGTIEYIPVIGTEAKGALLRTGNAAVSWYTPWIDDANGEGGLWENRITRMTELDIWGGDTEPHLAELTNPTVVIHADRAASGPDAPRRLFEVIASAEKKLVWFEDQVQTMFYDDGPTVARAAETVHEWFSTHTRG